MMRAGSKAQKKQRVLLALCACAFLACVCCSALDACFVPGQGPAALTRADPRVAMHYAAGEYKGFVPDMQRRTLMNLVVVAATAVPAGVLLGGFLYFFLPVLPSDSSAGQAVGDSDGNPVKLADWMKTHRNKDREL